MAESKTIVKQKRMGRPVTVEGTKSVGLRLPEKLLETVDRWAKVKGISRSEAFRQLAERGLAASERGKR
jgi:metal-responsive CopG/Arc/MetJ family transcriptional regulator